MAASYHVCCLFQSLFVERFADESLRTLSRTTRSEYDACGRREARVGGGQREEDRSSLSFNAWIVIAVGLLVVIVLGLHVPVYLTYRHEQKIVAESRRLGVVTSTEEHAPPWPMSVLANRWELYGGLFVRVAGVELGSSATDAARLTGLTELRYLFLYNTQITDAGLVHLGGLTELRLLYLGHTQVTDAGLVHLAGLTELRRLHLSNTQVTDAGLIHLAGPTELQELWLDNTHVTDAGVAELKRALPGLSVHR
jgi:hypothetical protein